MEEYTEKQILSRSDIAARLREIADAVETGKLAAGDLHVDLPDRAEFELEVEPKELEVKVEWS